MTNTNPTEQSQLLGPADVIMVASIGLGLLTLAGVTLYSLAVMIL